MQKTISELENKKNNDRWKKIITLEGFGKPASEYLIKALKDDDMWVRYLAADALSNIGATNAVEPIIKLLKDPEQDVRFVAASSLGKLGDPKAVTSLREVLKNDNGYVKISAEEALAMISNLNSRI